ncbi:hypothetical protein HYPSUDRAFT_200485 [Hypholoma sublateritium FD-334 SS-4]|uniref:Uncharacterized protein n=1 Tax=Hypholoma sublateritium (strain FD-334 SS-4) TaxID=945553 RepID=A0A0D2P7J9_HYPSF|nr:hypothetical protein HYPSUDRAFT_200485 [Hypholoma sublateritium FD-334 SS-4]
MPGVPTRSTAEPPPVLWLPDACCSLPSGPGAASGTPRARSVLNSSSPSPLQPAHAHSASRRQIIKATSARQRMSLGLSRSTERVARATRDPPLCDGTRRHFRRHANRTGRGYPRILMRLDAPARKGEIARPDSPRAEMPDGCRDRSVLCQSSRSDSVTGVAYFSGRMRIRRGGLGSDAARCTVLVDRAGASAASSSGLPESTDSVRLLDQSATRRAQQRTISSHGGSEAAPAFRESAARRTARGCVSSQEESWAP